MRDQRFTDWAQKTFLSAHLTKEQATFIGNEFNTFGAVFAEAIIKENEEDIKKQIGEASAKLKTELGDKYDAGIELANRFWKKHSDTEFDKVFDKESNGNRFQMIRFLIKVAKLTGEDFSPSGIPGKGTKGADWFPNTPDMKK